MRFVSFLSEGGCESVGFIADEEGWVYELSHPSCRGHLGLDHPTLLSMIEHGLDDVVDLLRTVHLPDDAKVPLESLQLLCPIRPGKILGAAFNFKDGLDEKGMQYPSEPVVFFRSGQTVVGPNQPICIPSNVGHVGYEAELAVVMGRRALRVSEQGAMDYVAGYVAHNDVSASELIKQDHGDFLRGKNLLSTAPIGPWLATKDEVHDPHALSVQLTINGVLRQSSTTAQMLHRIPKLIAFLSHKYPLEPGDVIATGTPAGTATSHRPAAWLVPGNEVVVRVEGLGELRNPVVQSKAVSL